MAYLQDKFASLMGISVATLRNWEQGRRKPEGPARVLLRVASKHPEAILDITGRPKMRRGHNNKMQRTRDKRSLVFDNGYALRS